MAAGCLGLSPDASSRNALRRTPLVEVFEKCKASVVRITARRTERAQPSEPKGKAPSRPARVTKVQWGTGVILHEAGYILTNSHSLRFKGRREVSLHDGKSFPVRVIAADRAHDLALFKIEAGRPLKAIRLGDSADLMVGEPAITIGNPFGIGLTIASGIVSALDRSTRTEYTHLSGMIQTDASINPGSSGGPLLNIAGELIGIVTCRKSEAENIGFAIPVDRVRALLPEILAPELRCGFLLGIKVAVGSPARVTEVVKGSPAEAAGVRLGDVVTHVDNLPVRRGIDFYLALVDRKGGRPLGLRLLRRRRVVEASVTLGEVELRPPDDVSGLVNGLDFRAYRGRWRQLPGFDQLRPASSGTMESFGLGKLDGKDWFGLKITGYIEAPADGVYVFYTYSDDGSQLHIGDQVVVDNDGLHPAAERRGFIPLKAGKHPIRVTFFEAAGDDELHVYYEGPGIDRQEIPASALYRPGTRAEP